MLRVFVLDDFQAQAQARVRRAEQRHQHPEGFETEVTCMGDILTKDECDTLPEWHVEQLDGKCFFGCRRHALKAIELATPVPLDKNKWLSQN